MFQEKARIERFSTIKALLSCKLTAGSSVAPHVLKMKGHLKDLERVDALTNLVSRNQINSLKSTNVVCRSCGGSHSYSQCNLSTNEDVNYVQGGLTKEWG